MLILEICLSEISLDIQVICQILTDHVVSHLIKIFYKNEDVKIIQYLFHM